MFYFSPSRGHYEAMLPNWALSARKLPIAFAQVREDPALDLALLEKLPTNARVLMIASGGCTAAYLAASGRVKTLELVDPNPAQLALAKLKLRLLVSPPRQRLEVLGHAPMDRAARWGYLSQTARSCGFQPDVFGDPDTVCELGPDHSGRYERVFATLREAIADQRPALRRVLALTDIAAQSEAVHPETKLGQRLDAALDETMSLPILVYLFGEEATKNPVEPFALHFARRIRHAFATLPAATNPFLWQMLFGAYPDLESNAAPWLALPKQVVLPKIVYTQAFMADVLKQPREPQHFVHLSNILDWLSPDKARETLQLAWNALLPGGMVLIRQLNSSLDIRALAPQFEWLAPESAELHACDRSFFYRDLHWGRRPA